MTTQLAILLCSLVVAILGVFFSKNGDSNKVSLVGYIILLLILVGGALGVVNSIETSRNQRASRIAEEEANNRARRAQNAALLANIELGKPFRFGNFNMNTIYDYDSDVDGKILGSPAQSMKFGLFPDRAVGAKVASISLVIDDLSFQADFQAVEEGLKVKEFERESTFSTAYECKSVGQSECDIASRGKNGPSWFFERLNQFDGGGFFLDRDYPSGKIVSALQRAGNLGSLVVFGPFEDRTAWQRFYRDHVDLELYYEQESREVSLRKVCSRILTSDVQLVPNVTVGKDPNCSSFDLCFEIRTRGNLDVELCQPSRT